jgi:hypothetical protein
VPNVEIGLNWAKSTTKGQFGAMIRRIPAFQQAAVCLTKFGSESGETAEEIVARKDLERRAGVGTHKNEFWWGFGERRAAQSTQTLISQHGGNTVLFSAIKDQTPPNNGSATDTLVWRKYRMVGGDILQDIPKHVLITSAAVTKCGTTPTKHFALVCNSSVALTIGGRAFRFSNSHYKTLSKGGKLGKSARSQRTTAALVKLTNSPISGAECDSLIDFSADLCMPYCVELFDPVLILPSVVAKLKQQIASGLGIRQWRLAVATIRQ